MTAVRYKLNYTL